MAYAVCSLPQSPHNCILFGGWTSNRFHSSLRRFVILRPSARTASFLGNLPSNSAPLHSDRRSRKILKRGVLTAATQIVRIPAFHGRARLPKPKSGAFYCCTPVVGNAILLLVSPHWQCRRYQEHDSHVPFSSLYSYPYVSIHAPPMAVNTDPIHPVRSPSSPSFS